MYSQSCASAVRAMSPAGVPARSATAYPRNCDEGTAAGRIGSGPVLTSSVIDLAGFSRTPTHAAGSSCVTKPKSLARNSVNPAAREIACFTRWCHTAKLAGLAVALSGPRGSRCSQRHATPSARPCICIPATGGSSMAEAAGLPASPTSPSGLQANCAMAGKPDPGQRGRGITGPSIRKALEVLSELSNKIHDYPNCLDGLMFRYPSILMQCSVSKLD